MALLVLCLVPGMAAGQEEVQLYGTAFDSDAQQADWVLSGDWRMRNNSACLQPALGYTSPATALVFSSTSECAYRNNRIGFATLEKDIAIPINLPKVSLHWWDYAAAELGADFYFVQISTDGGNTWPHEVFRDSVDELFWDQETVDLTPFIGSSIRIRFGFTTDDTVTNIGWYIDDVHVVGETLPEGVSAVAVNPASITEGNAGTKTLNFTLTIDPVNAEEIVLEHETVGGTAVAGLDFVAASGPIVIPAGASTHQVPVLVLGDAFFEPSESFTLLIGNPPDNARITVDSAQGTILDDDPLSCLYEEGFETPDGTFPWSLGYPSLQAPEDTDCVSSFTAPGCDLQLWHIQTGSGCILPAQGGGYISPARALVFNREADCSYDTPGGVVGVVEMKSGIPIPDVDALSAQLSFSHFLEIAFNTIQPQPARACVQISTDARTSWQTLRCYGPTEPSDRNFLLPWQEEHISLDDYLGEDVFIRFVFEQPAEVNRNTARGWYIDDFKICYAPRPAGVSKVTLGAASAPEGNTGTSLITFPVTIQPPNPSPVTLSYGTAALSVNNAATPDVDYMTTSGTVTIPASTPLGNIPIVLVGDDEPEAAQELFSLSIANVSTNVFLVNTSAAGTILDDDAPSTFDAGIANTSPLVKNIPEEAGTVTIEVLLSQARTKAITVNYTTRNGTALAGVGLDYVAASGTLTFPPNTRRRTFNLTILDDTQKEPDETLDIVLTTDSPYASNAAIPLTIVDNEPGPVPGASDLSVNDVTVTEGSCASISAPDPCATPFNAVFTVTLATPNAGDISMDYMTEGNTAEAETDFVPVTGTVTIPALSTTATITVPIYADRAVEGGAARSEQFNLVLFNPQGNVNVVDNTGVCTIRDDDFLETAFGVDGSDIALRDLSNPAEERYPLVGVPLALTAAEFKAFEFNRLYGWHQDRLISVNLVSGAYTEVANLGALTAGDLSGLAWDHTNGDALACSTSGEILRINLANGTVVQNNNLGAKKWVALAVHPTSARIYGVALNGGAAELHAIFRGTPFTSSLIGAINGITPGAAAKDAFWDCDFQDTTGELYLNAYASGGADPDHWETRTVQLTAQDAPPVVDSRVRLANAPVSSIAIATPPPPPSVRWMTDLPYAGSTQKGAELTADPAANNAAGIGPVISGLGDINGDTFEDFAIGAPLNTPAGGQNEAGQVFIVFGGPESGYPDLFSRYLGGENVFSASTFTAKNGIIINGSAANQRLGVSVSGVGDMNRDGLSELAIGYQGADSAGGVFLVYGSRLLPGVISASTIGDTAQGATVKGVNIRGVDANDKAGAAVSGAGDFNGDGFDDMVIGAPHYGAGAAQGAGAAYVIFGTNTGIGSSGLLNLQSLAPPAGVRILGEKAMDQFGASVGGVGDVNGDGLGDIAFGAPNALTGKGYAVVLFGHPDYSLATGPNPINFARLSDGDPSQVPPLPNSLYFTVIMPADGGLAALYTPQFILLPPYKPGDLGKIPGMRLSGSGVAALGTSVSGLGDVNGDGLDDMIVGAPGFNGAAQPEPHTGRAYVVLGARGEDHKPEFTEAQVGAAVPGMIVIPDDDPIGGAVAGAGDVNGDGLMDILIGSPTASPGGFSGESCVLFGAKGFTGTFSLRDLGGADEAAAKGFYLYNMADGAKAGLGAAVAPAGDINNDGTADFLVGRTGGLFALLGASGRDSATYLNVMRSGVNDVGSGLPSGGGIDLGLSTRRPVGSTGNGKHLTPASRVTIEFKNGGVGPEKNNPSTQSVVLYKKAAPDVPVGNGAVDDALWVPAGVHWLLQTDRQGFSESKIELHYRPEEIAGLNPDKLAVFYAKPGKPLSSTTTWSWLPFVHDSDRRVFTISRTHGANPQADFNGYYAIIQADLLTYLGGVIPSVGVTPDTVYLYGPEVVPSTKAFWHQRDKRLYAVGAGEVRIKWKNAEGTVVSEVRVLNLWPEAATGNYQELVANTPAVDMNTAGTSVEFKYGRITESDATFVKGTNVDANNVMQDRLFTGGLTRNDDPNNPQGPENTETTARVLVMLSTKEDPSQGDIYFQFVRMVKWNNSAVIKGGVAGVSWPVGQYIAGATSTQYRQYHDETAGSPFVMFAKAPYAPKTTRYPGFYDRTSRTGTIVPVNVKRKDESDLVLAFYQHGTRLIDGRTGNRAVVPGTSQTLSAFQWPYTTTKYNLAWTPTGASIVIAKQNGTGELDVTAYGTNLDVYVQNDPALPGFNPNEEHALIAPYGGGNAMFALRNDLNNTANPQSDAYTSEPYAMLVYDDPNDLLPDGSPRTKTKPYKVVAEEGIYTFSPWPGVPAAQDPFEGTAGAFINPPYPLSIFAYVPENTFTSDSADYVFEDRTDRHWAKSATGTSASIKMLFYYPPQPGFYFPPAYISKHKGGSATAWSGNVPFLDGGASVSTKTPKPVQYQTAWPANVPTMKLGEVLIEAKYGLPQINGQCSVDLIYMQSGTANPSAKLIDPVITRKVALEELPTDVSQGFRAGEITFPLLPPKLDYRVSWDPLARVLKFKGILVDPVTGFDYVLLNVMTAADRDAILALSPSNASNTASDWHKAVTALYNQSRNTYDIANSSTTPYEVLALSTGDARGTGYVTLAMQNANSCSPLPVSLEILRVVAEPNPGNIAIVKPSCVFDEKLTLTSTLDFGGNPGNFEFEWRYVPDEGGTLPDMPNPSDPTDPWKVPPLNTPTSGAGINEITIEGPTLLTLTDNWFAMRYRRVGGAAPWGNQYSAWTPVQMAPGWIKRVVGQINPYTQRASGGGIEGAEESFASFNADAPNTIISMISQAGPRFTGSVPLNCDNLDAFGLIPIYETVLNRGATLSIDSLSPINNPQVNTALLLVASRIADLYALLGNEAYADAQDPTIGFGTKDGTYGTQATSIHAFMNQTSSLLEEELTLLRGRDDTFAPALNVDPVYNRLYWNFTTDMTGGEVAYALNYNILDNVNGGNGVIDEADAKRLYPQGHGDAWGHYLTALSRYYRLLRHPFYTWSPRTEAVLVGGQPVTVDFLDERKFATIAAAKARAGAEIVNLAYSNSYVEDPSKQWQGLRDKDPGRAWGFSEWASRAGQGALIDWAVGNAVLRAVDPDPDHKGIQKIDRTTVQDLIEVASRFEEVQAKCDEADIGLNPLGLGTNVIPFDISPSEIDAGKTHFQQIWDRAVTALQNSGAAFDNAVGATQLLRQQNDSVQDFQRAAQETELDFQSRLIEIFGYPYSDDIGPGGLYESGYEGPDIFHYMLGDKSGIERDNQLRVAPYNVTSSGNTNTANIPSYAESLVSGFVAQNQYNIGKGSLVFEVGMRNYGTVQGTDGVTMPTGGPLTKVPITVKYNMSVTNGLFGITKPSNWTGQRRAPGEIQNARSELVQAVGRFMSAVDDYGSFVGKVDDTTLMLQKQFNLSADKISLIDTRNDKREDFQKWTIGLKSTQIGLNVIANLIEKITEAGKESVPTVTGIIIGFSNGIIIDGLAPVRGGLKLGGTIAVETLKAVANLLDIPMLAIDQAMARQEDTLTIETARLEGKFANLQAVYELQDLLRSEIPLRIAVHSAHEAVVQAIGNYQKALAEGVRTLDRREIFRNQTAADTQSFRYRDMAFRIFRNDALQKYRAQFDLAARYTYLAAKAYDYETTMLSNDPRAGSKFLTDIVKARSIGAMADGQPQTGQGLANPLAVMARNFDVLSGQLGFNNPQVETNRFSLRHELFRVLPTSDNPSDPTWRNILKQDYHTFGAGTVDNLWDVPEFREHCVPPDGFGAVEPGIVIPFTTTIVEGKNFFGRGDYGALDSSYDSTQFATKIRSVGVWFSNYDVLGLSNTPRIWLVPAGVDYLRSPSSASGKPRAFSVMDQVLPVPFPIGTADIGAPGWIPKIDTLSAPMIPIRRHGRFRAYHDSGEFSIDEMQRDSRLIGRSVWNSRWMLIIPASTLSNDRAEGLARFVDGRTVNGVRNGNGVSDIKVFFETYAFPRLKSDGSKEDN